MSSRKIIGYFHICQIGEWKRSFDMVFNFIKNYGLYDNTVEIRCGILSESGTIIDDYRFKDPKFKIIFVGTPNLYERPTLLHMRNNCHNDGPETAYWYLHTKGLRHFNTVRESFVLDWINLMLYWNIQKWELALEKLNHYDTYGCNNFFDVFYSGNFWWANSSHIAFLPTTIDDYYTAPEDWILKKKDKMLNIFSSGIQGEGHYNMNYEPHNYVEDVNKILPEDFNVDAYRFFNKELKNLSNKECLEHFFSIGKSQNKKYNMNEYLEAKNKIKNFLPQDFSLFFYRRNYKDLENFNDDDELIEHWVNHGKNEKREYKLPDDFDYNLYMKIFPDLKEKNEEYLIDHWINTGKNIYYIIPNDFNIYCYRKSNNDLKELNDEGIIHHWLNHGKNENREYKMPNDFDYILYKKIYPELTNSNEEGVIEHWFTIGKLNNIGYKLPDGFDMNYYRQNSKDFSSFTDEQIIQHWFTIGKLTNIGYKLPDGFDINYYRKNSTDFSSFTDEQIIEHWIKIGKKDKMSYKLPDGFDMNYYKEMNKDLSSFTYDQIIQHWINHGRFENRRYKKK